MRRIISAHFTLASAAHSPISTHDCAWYITLKSWHHSLFHTTFAEKNKLCVVSPPFTLIYIYTACKHLLFLQYSRCRLLYYFCCVDLHHFKFMLVILLLYWNTLAFRVYTMPHFDKCKIPPAYALAYTRQPKMPVPPQQMLISPIFAFRFISFIILFNVRRLLMICIIV